MGSIKEASGATFDPANGSTYVVNTQALDLPPGEVANWIDEHGKNLLVAGDSFNKIYPWDRISDSFNLPILVPENSIKRIKNIGGTVYILAGTSGNIYSTQGVYTKFVKKLSHYVLNNGAAVQNNVITWGGIAQRNSALIFGVGGVSTASDGVWMLYPDGKLVIDNQPTTGATRATAIYADNEFYFIGYASGMDQHTTSRYSNFQGVVQTRLYEVALKNEKTGYSILEAQLARPGTTGDLRVGYRLDDRSAFTTLATYTLDGTNSSFSTDIGLIDIEKIQVQAELDSDVQLVELRLI